MWPTALPSDPQQPQPAHEARYAEPIVIGSTVRAFQPNIPAGTWPGSALPVAFVLALPRSRDIGAAAAAELEVALRTWPQVACTAWRTRYDGERAAVAADDGINVVLFHDDAWPPELVPGAVAQTVIHTDAGGFYRDADIHINGKDFRFSLDGAATTLDLRSILVHELGHALGLGHADDPRATMFATGSGLRWRSLEKDDVAGVCSLYPGKGAAGCDATACPSPFVCVANACQRPGELRDLCSPCDQVVGACEAAGDEARCVDIGVGMLAGRVCGRACAGDGECGVGFHCVATTTSGDRQCVSDVGCKNGASPCQIDAQCKDAICVGGACVGRAGADAGADGGGRDGGSVDAGGDAAVPFVPGGGGCSCDVIGRARSSSGTASSAALAWLSAVALTAALRARGGRGGR